MRYRLLALDMDGTVLDQHHALTERTIRALVAAGEAGTKVVLASGRMPCALRPFVEALRLTAPMICYNGAQVADSRTLKVMSSFAIDAALAREAARACEEMGLHIQAYRDEAFYCQKADPFALDYQAFLNCGVDLVQTHAPLSEWLTFDTPKLLAIDTPERVAERLPALKARFEGRLRVATSQPRFIEFVSPAAGKAAALEALCGLVDVPREAVMAFGDGLNDLDMIQWAGCGVAMANACGAVLAAADMTAPSNIEDGVAQVVERLLGDDLLGGR